MQLDFYNQFKVSIIVQKYFYLSCIFLNYKKMFYFVIIINWKNIFLNYSTLKLYTLKLY
jgi:hypothetical protein